MRPVNTRWYVSLTARNDVWLMCTGIGLSFILAPLTSDIYGEVTVLAHDNPGIINVRVAFVQAYAMFNAAMGLGCALGEV